MHSLSDRTRHTMSAVLAGEGGGWLRRLAFAGPAIIASVAYMDPGNYATNIQAGAGYGYALLWVVLLANLIAMLFQALSARLGIVTGKNLAELSRDSFPRPVVWIMWVVSEVAAMATDLAEFLGGAIGLALLFDLPLMAGMAITAIVTYAILILERQGFRPMELIIGALVGVIGLCYLAEMLIAPVDWGAAATGLSSPALPDAAALTIAVGIIGATVMPHAIYVHSALARDRHGHATDPERRVSLLRATRWDVVAALGVAGAVNIGMLLLAAANLRGVPGTDTIEGAHAAVVDALGPGIGLVFAIGLLASGLASTSVGCYAGATIMQGLLRRRIPLVLRRAITLAPALLILALGADPTWSLVISQVVLSFGIPFALVPLLRLTNDRAVMGASANSRTMTWTMGAIVLVVTALNLALVVLTLRG